MPGPVFGHCYFSYTEAQHRLKVKKSTQTMIVGDDCMGLPTFHFWDFNASEAGLYITNAPIWATFQNCFHLEVSIIVKVIPKTVLRSFEENLYYNADILIK